MPDQHSWPMELGACEPPRLTPGHAQFLIATHSPILLSYPSAVLFDLDGDTIRQIDYRETKHFLITRDFLNAPDRFFKHLFGAVADDGGDAS